MQKIVPFLWFDANAEDAVNFYVSVFKDAKIAKVDRYGEAGPGPKGSVMAIDFQLEGQDFIALNGGLHYAFTPAISLFVNCATQGEVDALWARFLEGGTPQQCGWITDRFGVTWQIVPVGLRDCLQDPDPARAAKAARAMFGQVKLDIGAIRQAMEA